MADYQTCADLSFRLNAQALAVGQMLAIRPPDFAEWHDHEYEVEIQTWPWFNGRERGIAIVLSRTQHDEEAAVFVVVENRTSDNIAVEEWWQSRVTLQNGPSLQSRDEALGGDEANRVYYDRIYFNYGEIGKAAEYVYERMSVAYKAQKARPAIVRVEEDSLLEGEA
jgi:hypothetical protein